MKLFTLFLTTALFLAPDNDLRSLKWGMTMDEVRQTESLTLEVKLGGKLKYSATIANIDFELLYEFKEERLYKAIFTNKENYLDKNSYIVDYSTIKGQLEKKYGTPKSSAIKWKNEQYKANEADWGKAVSEGHLDYHTQWQNDRTTIDLLLTGSSYNCTFTITYEARNTKWNQPSGDSTDDL